MKNLVFRIKHNFFAWVRIFLYLCKRIATNIAAFWVAVWITIFPPDRKKYIDIKSVKLFDPYIMIINFVYKGQSHYLILENEEGYVDLYKQVQKAEALPYLSELMPIEDVVAQSWRHWRYKKNLNENNT